MKYLFCLGLAVALAGALATRLTQPKQQTDVPVLFWTTSSNPSRIRAVERFNQWLFEEGHVTAEGKPMVELRLDPAGRDPAKQMIHGVSGVASDIHSGTMGYMEKAGMLIDVTEVAQEMGFEPGKTYNAVHADMTIEGRQFGFPDSVYTVNLWANVDTFRRYGMEPPPKQWDIATFEAYGREFVERANRAQEGKLHDRIFFLNTFRTNNNQRLIRAMHRDLGLDDFNETYTRCTLDDERYARVLDRVYRWTHEYHLVPTAADEASFSSEAGFGGNTLPLFYDGLFAMVASGRELLIRLREFSKPPRLSVSFYPWDRFQNTTSIARTSGIYKLSAHQDLALLFLKYLTSEAHNRLIIEEAYGIPAIPSFTELEEFKRPPAHPNEWGTHEVQAEATLRYSIPRPQNPFVPVEPNFWTKRDAWEKVISGMVSGRQAAREVGAKLNEYISQNVGQSTRLKRWYGKNLALQNKIDERKAMGEKIPVDWIKNAFFIYYYRFTGQLAEDSWEDENVALQAD